MNLFIKYLIKLKNESKNNNVKRKKDLDQIIYMLRICTKKQLDFMCES